MRRRDGRLLLLASLLLAVPLLSVLGAPAPAHAQRADDETDVLVSAARAAIARADYDQAANLLDRALALNPRRIDAYVLRATVLGVRGQNVEAVALLRRAQTLAPTNGDVLAALGAKLVAAGEPVAGLELLEQVVAREPRRYEAHAVLAVEFRRLGDHPRAIASLQAYLAARPASLAGRDRFYRLGLAESLLRSGEPAKARDLYLEVLLDDPTHPLARLGRAWATAALNCRLAMGMLRELGDLVDEVPAIELVRGRCALRLGRTTEGLALAKSYLGRDPSGAEGHALLGEAELASGNIKAALGSLARAAQAAPDNKNYLLALARAERQNGDPASAAKRLGATEPPAERRVEWTVELAEALTATERSDEALALLEPLRSSEADDARVFAALGLAAVALAKPAQAIADLSRAHELAPDDTRIKGPLAILLREAAAEALRTGDLATARARLERATAAVPDADSFRTLAAIALALGDARAALGPAEAASALVDDPVTLHVLARVYQALDRDTDARRTFAAASSSKRPLSRSSRDALAIDQAAFELASGDAVAAVEALAKVAADKQPSSRVTEALVVAARAAANDDLARGEFSTALRQLERAHDKLAVNAPGMLRDALECDLALAATGAGDRKRAQALLRSLAKRRASCELAPPADTVAVAILDTWVGGMVLSRAKAALKTLDSLGRKATGPARPLLDIAARDIAHRAAASSFDQGAWRAASDYLELAARYGKLSAEEQHNAAVVELALGKTVSAISQLERLTREVPEALLNLGIAYENRGDQVRALDYFERAAKAKLRHPGLAGWIAAKRRIWGGP